MSARKDPTAQSLNHYIEIATSLCNNDQLDKYIKYAVFPNFKNLENGARIDFNFPITAIIGPNGSGKSSILHALYGMPYNFSTSRFWFSTTLDPIEEGKNKGANRYFYSHLIRDISKHVETKKIRRRRNESYWEPARVSRPDGMQPIPKEYTEKEKKFRVADRWYPTFRAPIYISFKYQFSAFDRAFHVNNTGLTIQERIEKIKKSATKISKVITKGKQSYKPGGVESVFTNRPLTESELIWINHILGKKYVGATYLKHRLYEKESGLSIIFQTESGQYSEAFAGSGELAVVNLVTQLLNGEKNSLVLLDEPETSLHPGAQENLIRFLLWSVIEKHYQIVISTHSPTITQSLPKEALYALLETDEGKTAISQVAHPHMAFHRIGHIPDNKKLVIVEDQLLLKLVEVALDELSDWQRESIRLELPSSGGDEIFKYLLPIHGKENREVYYILDGDKKPKASLDLDKLDTMESKEIFDKIKEAYCCEPLHLKPDDKEGCINYIKRASKNVFNIRAECPEAIFLEIIGYDNAHSLSNQEAKRMLVEHLEDKKLGSSAEIQHALFNYHLRNNEENPHINDVAKFLGKISTI